jgi:hypothetical protein
MQINAGLGNPVVALANSDGAWLSILVPA